MPVPNGGLAFRMHAEPSRILQIRRPDTEALTGVYIGDPGRRAIGLGDDLDLRVVLAMTATTAAAPARSRGFGGELPG